MRLRRDRKEPVRVAGRCSRSLSATGAPRDSSNASGRNHDQKNGDINVADHPDGINRKHFPPALAPARSILISARLHETSGRWRQLTHSFDFRRAMTDLFLSYSREDAAQVEQLANALAEPGQ